MRNVFLILSLAILWGCNSSEDTLGTQQSSIVRYLESSHSPRLISEEAARESLDDNPEYYTVLGRTAYRYIATMYENGRDSRTEIGEGDIVEIYFDAYVFNYASLNNVAPYWSNREETIEALGRTGGGLDPAYWSTDPLALKAGQAAIDGISRSLVGCREGDRVEVYMTFKAAYGKGIVGLVPKESPVAWLFTIERVTKR